MPRKYNIAVLPAPPRVTPPGKYVIVRGDECLNCGRCTKVCIYGVHQRLDEDPRRMADPESQRCKGCFRCVQECPRAAITLIDNETYTQLGDSYWTPEIITTTWYQAETGKVPVSGAGYSGPFSGSGFDGMWTDISEIVRPTRDGIHGREYISTSVDIGGNVQAITFDGQGKITVPPPRTRSVPLPIIFERPPLGRSEKVYEALAKAAATLDTVMFVDSGEWYERGYAANLVPVYPAVSEPDQQPARTELESCLKTAPMVEFSYDRDILKMVADARSISPGSIISVRVPSDEAVEEIVAELVDEGVDVIHLCTDRNGRTLESSTESRFVTDMIRTVHRYLVHLKMRDRVTLIAGGGIALPEHVAKAILCGADLTAIDVPLLLALECRYCRNCLHGKACPVGLDDLDPDYGAQRIVNLMAAWRNQLLEVLGAMGLREVRRLRGEVGRAIVCEEIQKETFDRMFVKEVFNHAKARN
jgi:ferredoxin